MAISPGRTMVRRKRSEHYVNNKEFLGALIKYREEVELTFIKKYGREPLNRKMGYISNVNDAKELLEKLYKLNKPKKPNT